MREKDKKGGKYDERDEFKERDKLKGKMQFPP